MADGIAKKKDPQKWAQAKARAKAKMGGKHSARAMQLATKYYKDGGGKYEGKKPSSKNNKMKKWTTRIGVLSQVKIQQKVKEQLAKDIYQRKSAMR